MDGIISLPVAIAGFFLLPDLPEITRARYFNETVSRLYLTSSNIFKIDRRLAVQDIILARRRMEVEGRVGRKPYTKQKLIQIFTSWRFWTLVPLYA